MTDFSEIFGCVRDTKQSGNTFGKINAKGRSYISMLEKQLAECQATNGKLTAGLKAVSELINESTGVFGLHLNGDVAPWEELRTGGRFESWLLKFDEALALPNDTTALNELIEERTASLTAEVERLSRAVKIANELLDLEGLEDAETVIDQLRQQNAELAAQLTAFKDAAEYNKRRAEDAEKQRDALLDFAAAYIAAWNNGSTGDSDLFFMAESAIAKCKEQKRQSNKH